MIARFYRRFRCIPLGVALLTATAGAEAAIQTWISGTYTPPSGSMQVDFAGTTWSMSTIPGRLQTKYFNLDEGVEYMIEVTGTNVSEHTLTIGVGSTDGC